MAIILNGQDMDQKSNLQKRITSELREKSMKKSTQPKDVIGPEYSPEDSEYMKDLKPTTSLAWVWAIIFIAIICIVVAVAIVTS
jgi:hypothetical protein